jgi:hypothetical protein
MNSKINITFADMDGLRKILIKTFFLIVVSLCLGINFYSYCSLQHINNEILTGNNGIEYSFGNNSDTLNEDEIIQAEDLNLSTEPVSFIHWHQVFYPVHIFSLSIWQPPKIS